MACQGSGQTPNAIHRIGNEDGRMVVTVLCPVCQTEQRLSRCVIAEHDAPCGCTTCDGKPGCCERCEDCRRSEYCPVNIAKQQEEA